MVHKKTYFILPTTVYKPDDYIQLGQVITNPREPWERLAKPLPLEGDLAPRTSPSLEWSATNTQTGESSVGIFAHVVHIMTAEVSAGKSGNERQTWEAALLETKYFEISEDKTYAERTAKVPAVHEWLKKNRRLGKSVYMITGLKIAKNPGKVTYDGSDASHLGADLKATVDPEDAVEVGAKANIESSNAATYEATPENAYVFAYRLRKLRVSWGKTLSVRGNVGGAELHNAGQRIAEPEADSEDEDDSAFEMEGVALDDEDFGPSLPPKDKKFPAVDEDDNSECTVIRANS